MQNMQHTIHTILYEQRMFGYADPTWYIWGANQIVQALSSLGPGREQERGYALFLATSLLRQGATFSPFDRELYAMLFKLQQMVKTPENLLAWVRWADGQVKDLGLGSLNQAVEKMESLRDDPDGVIALLEKDLPLHEYHLCLIELWRLREAELFFEHLERFMKLPGAAPAAPVFALAAWRGGRPGLAEELAAMAPNCFITQLLKAEQALEAGNTAAAQAHWRMSLKLEPLQPTLILKLHESLQPAPPADAVRDAKVHVAFYTWNKLEMTLDTLSSLLASDIGDARVTLLNNGSTAFSPEELQQGVDAVRQGRPVELIHLPTNIGAPAARNWLRRLPASLEADYLAYLDDDVLLPKNWLAHYIQDLRENDGVVCAGPQCINPGELTTVQYVWRYFARIGDHNIRFSNNCPQFMDVGQYSSRRYCLSVMGCCHLFDMRRVEALNLPDFDIRFSPSQVDDLEHDMQIWKAGGRVLYDGRVRVVHRQVTGKQSRMARDTLGNILGNHRKMEAKWPLEELTRVNNEVNDVDNEHYIRCHDAVRGLLPKEARNLLNIYCLRQPSPITRPARPSREERSGS